MFTSMARRRAGATAEDRREKNRIRSQFIRLVKMGLSGPEAAQAAQGQLTPAQVNALVSAAEARADRRAGRNKAMLQLPGDEGLNGPEKRQKASDIRAQRAQAARDARAAQAERHKAAAARVKPADKGAPQMLQERNAEQEAKAVKASAKAPKSAPAPAAAPYKAGDYIAEGAENGNWPDVLSMATTLSAEPIKNRRHAEQVIRDARSVQRGETPQAANTPKGDAR